MKKTWLLLPLLLVACKKHPPPPAAGAASASAAVSTAAASAAPAGGLSILDGFEGQVSFRASGNVAGAKAGEAKHLDLILLVKDKKLRLEVPADMLPQKDLGRVYAIVEVEAKKFYAVVESKKQAYLFDLEKMLPQVQAMAKNMTGGKPGAGAAAEHPTVTKTGKKDKVAGYACEVWEITQKGKKMELCVTSETTAWLKLPTTTFPPEMAWAAELGDGKHFPLRFVSFANGVEEGRVELSGIEKKALPAGDFEVPRGFMIVSLDQMMAGLGGLVGGGGMRGMPGMPPGMAGMMPSGMPMHHGKAPTTGPATQPKPAKAK